jgi:fatty-acyl-CoA synthase
MRYRSTLVACVEDLDDDRKGLGFWQSQEFLPYAKLRSVASVRAHQLYQHGVRKGDRVILVLNTEQEFIECFFATLRAGATAVPLYPPPLLGNLELYRGNLLRVAKLVSARLIVASTSVVDLLSDGDGCPTVVGYQDLASSDDTGNLPDVSATDLALIQFTSGSTQSPRGVPISHGSLMANSRAIINHLKLTADDCGVSWLPLFHDMGLIGFVVTPVVTGGSTWYISPLEFAKRPTIWCDVINKVRGTVSYAPNFGYSLVARRASDIELKEWDLRCWRVAGCGAEPIRRDSLMAFADRLFLTGFDERAFIPSYGLAEMTLAVSMASLDRPIESLVVSKGRLENSGEVVEVPADSWEGMSYVSNGLPLENVEVRIVSATSGEELGEGREGEITVRGPSGAGSYFEDREASEGVFRNGWTHTGDLGFIYRSELYPSGRLKDLIIVNGRNIHPEDIEAAVGDLQGICKGGVVVFGVADSQGEAIIVVAEVRNTTDDLRAVQRAVRGTVGAMTGVTTRDVVLVEKKVLPRTTSGKSRRSETKSLFIQSRLVSCLDGSE